MRLEAITHPDNVDDDACRQFKLHFEIYGYDACMAVDMFKAYYDLQLAKKHGFLNFSSGSQIFDERGEVCLFAWGKWVEVVPDLVENIAKAVKLTLQDSENSSSSLFPSIRIPVTRKEFATAIKELYAALTNESHPWRVPLDPLKQTALESALSQWRSTRYGVEAGKLWRRCLEIMGKKK